MKNDGESYSNYIDDIIGGIYTKDLKHTCASLLLTFSKKIPGFANFAFNYTHELLELNFDDNRDFSKFNFNFLTKEDLIFRLNISQEYQIDLAIFIYCILRIRATKKSGYITQIAKIFNNYFDKIKNIQSNLINNRLCVFYGLYLDEIFSNEILFDEIKSNDDKFLYGFEFLMKAILDFEIYPGTSYLVNEFKFNFFKIIFNFFISHL